MSTLPQTPFKNILICAPLATAAQINLKNNKSFNVENYTPEKLSTANALIIRSKFLITSELLAQTPNLELIVTCTSGFDHIDLVETQKKNICVMYTPEANAQSAAELTWALLMASTRHLVTANENVKSGRWSGEVHRGVELANKTLGIVGLGRIGSLVAKFANTFGMKVLAFDPYKGDSAFQIAQAVRASYEEVLRQSEFLSFHVPATKETQNMFNRAQIDCVHPDLILINTSRGCVINEADLIRALKDKKIKFAALDVFNKEPLTVQSQLLQCPNIILTPHIGAYTEESFLKSSLEGSLRITEFFADNKTKNTLPSNLSSIEDWQSQSFSERT